MGAIAFLLAATAAGCATLAVRWWPGWVAPIPPEARAAWQEKHAWCRLLCIGAAVTGAMALPFILPGLLMP